MKDAPIVAPDASTMPNALLFRRPRWMFAALGLGLLFLIGYGLTVFIASGIGYDAGVAQALIWPGALGAGLSAGVLWRRIAACRIRRRRDVAGASALAWGATGFAWPLSFGLSTLIDEGTLDGLRHSIIPALAGAALAASAGAVAAWIASYAALRRA